MQHHRINIVILHPILKTTEHSLRPASGAPKWREMLDFDCSCGQRWRAWISDWRPWGFCRLALESFEKVQITTNQGQNWRCERPINRSFRVWDIKSEGTPPGYMAAIDPRHPSLGMRVMSSTDTPSQTPMETHEQRKETFSKMMRDFFPEANGSYNVIRKLGGVAEGSEITGKTALETNQDFLNSVSFQKGWLPDSSTWFQIPIWRYRDRGWLRTRFKMRDCKN